MSAPPLAGDEEIYAPKEIQILPSLPLVNVNHIGLSSRYVEKSRRFYSDVLGFREVQRPNLDFPGAWLFGYGIMIHVIENPDTPEVVGPIKTRETHLAIHAPDLIEVQRLLEMHQIPFHCTHIKDGNIGQIFFRDPDGHHIEIGTYPATPAFL